MKITKQAQIDKLTVEVARLKSELERERGVSLTIGKHYTQMMSGQRATIERLEGTASMADLRAKAREPQLLALKDNAFVLVWPPAGAASKGEIPTHLL